jgi:hypothetical protein
MLQVQQKHSGNEQKAASLIGLSRIAGFSVDNAVSYV